MSRDIVATDSRFMLFAVALGLVFGLSLIEASSVHSMLNDVNRILYSLF